MARAGETRRGSQGLLSLLAHRAAGTARPCPGTRCHGSLRCSDPRPDGSTQHRGSSTRRGAFVARAACGLFGQRSAGFGQVAGPSTRRCQGASPSATRPPSLRLRARGTRSSSGREHFPEVGMQLRAHQRLSAARESLRRETGLNPRTPTVSILLSPHPPSPLPFFPRMAPKLAFLRKNCPRFASSILNACMQRP